MNTQNQSTKIKPKDGASPEEKETGGSTSGRSRGKEEGTAEEGQTARDQSVERNRKEPEKDTASRSRNMQKRRGNGRQNINKPRYHKRTN